MVEPTYARCLRAKQLVGRPRRGISSRLDLTCRQQPPGHDEDSSSHAKEATGARYCFRTTDVGVLKARLDGGGPASTNNAPTTPR